jgi:DnaJ-class molecular chaperone
MKHRRFSYRCPICDETGLQTDPTVAYKVRVCDACTGSGKLRLTVKRLIEIDRQLRRSPDASERSA